MKEEIRKALEIIEREAECFEDYDKYQKAMDLIDELTAMFEG